MASSMVVPPTEVTNGWVPGSSAERTGVTGLADTPAQSSEPSSPAGPKTLWPCAAASSKIVFSSARTPGAPVAIDCSQAPQLLEISCALFWLTMTLYSSSAPYSVSGRLVDVDTRLRGDRRDVFDVQCGLARPETGLLAAVDGDDVLAAEHLLGSRSAEIARVEHLDVRRRVRLELEDGDGLAGSEVTGAVQAVQPVRGSDLAVGQAARARCRALCGRAGGRGARDASDGGRLCSGVRY